MKFDSFRAMNTDFTVMVESENPFYAFDTVREMVEEAEERFSRFQPNSELCQLNQSSGSLFDASPDMLALLQIALDCHQLTDGLFNPAILPALEVAGYWNSFDTILLDGSHPMPSRPSFPANLNFQDIEINSEKGTIRLPKNGRIDLGGITKGWIAEKAARKIASTYQISCCAVNAGGDMFLYGTPSTQPNWQLSVQDPYNLDADLMEMVVTPGGIATSSVIKRSWRLNGKPMHHLIDPRTGQPASSVWASVTAMAASSVLAEVIAKAILLGGDSAAKALSEKGVEFTYLGVDQQKKCAFFDKSVRYEL